MNNVEMPVNLVQALLNYLQTRPYSEVAALIAEIMQHKPAVHEVPDDSEAVQNPK
jgi:hypothetical protein